MSKKKKQKKNTHQKGSAVSHNVAMASRSWYDSHGRDLRFLMIFAVLMGFYYLISTTELLEKQFFPWYLKATTNISGVILHMGGSDVIVDGNTLEYPDPEEHALVTVERGCDAIAPTALFISAVIASPAPWLAKFPAILGGAFILMIVNIIRVVTLYLTRVFWLKAFDIMHLDVWQALFIFLSILLWAFWAAWTTKRMKRQHDAAT